MPRESQDLVRPAGTGHHARRVGRAETRWPLMMGMVWMLSAGSGALATEESNMIPAWFLLAPLVLVPLSLEFAPVRHVLGGARFVEATRPWLVGGAISLALSFFVSPGWIAALLSAPWLVVCAGFALSAFFEAWRSGEKTLHQATMVAAFVMMAIGACWAAASRAGMKPMGFEEPIVLLTAMHFHFAGYCTLIITALVGSNLPPRAGAARKIHRCAAIGLVAGVPLLAAGFVLSPVLQLAAAILIAVGLVCIAQLQLVTAARVGQPAARILLYCSSISIIGGMGLACYYAVGEFLGQEFISIEVMAIFHGLCNAIGFSLCGMIGWRLADAHY